MTTTADIFLEFQHTPELQSLLLKNVEETGRWLGTGSYGSVIELKFDGSPCAGKKLHEDLIDARDVGARRRVLSFLEECKLMSKLRHPNITQFFGICVLPCSNLPLLVTELLSGSLHDYLTNHENLPLSRKRSILCDVAKGLVYLHSLTPPIIHRDLTAKNVLLEDLTLKAKIADLGNSLLHVVDPTIASCGKTMTRFPGTLSYMPPEAQDGKAKYGSKLDIFSFGHLALFTITQVLPLELLAVTYNDSEDRLIARSEVERRSVYLEILCDTIGETHSLVDLVKQCLHNSAYKRPSAMEVLHWLEVSKSMDCRKADVMEDNYEAVYNTVYPLGKDEMVEYICKKEREISDLKKQIEDRTMDYEVVSPNYENVADGRKSAPLEKLSKRKKWKLYSFKLENQVLKYFKPGVKRPRKELILSQVTRVFPVSTEDDNFCFEVHFIGKSSPWKLGACSEMERKSWIDAIQKQGSPKMNECNAYGLIPDDTYAYIQDANVEGLYEDITDFNLQPQEPCHPPSAPPIPQSLPPKLHQMKSKQTQGLNLGQPHEDNSVQGQEQLHMQSLSQVYEMIGNTASSFTPAQRAELIQMLQTIQNKTINNKSSSPTLPTIEEPEEVYEEIPSEALHTMENPEIDDKYVALCSKAQTELHPQTSENDKKCNLQIDMSDRHSLQKMPQANHTPSPSHSFGKNTLACGPTIEESQQSLKKMLKKTAQVSSTQLLITEDSADEYIVRPSWAKAATSNTQPDALAVLHHKSLYLSPLSLININELGEGQFGKVYKAEMKKKSQIITVAVKTVGSITDDFQKEVTIMSGIIHPNIVQLYGLINEGNLAPAMVMEYMPNGNLRNFLKVQKRDNDQLVKYMVDVAMGMHYLSERGIIHRDLAARNVLLDSKEVCKVADFGLVREVPKDTSVYISQSRGPSPLRWMAPESLQRREFSPASDVWSFGILVWEMFNPQKDYPYHNMLHEELVVNIAKGYRLPTPRHGPPTVVHIMKACWNTEPNKRPSFLLITNLLTSEIFALN